MLLSLSAFLVGVAVWTLLEYLMHRFAFHGGSLKWPGAKVHRRHHTQADFFVPWWQKAMVALAVIAILAPLLSLVVGVQLGVIATLGVVSGYLLYEIVHRRAHTYPPRGRYGRWLRKNHFAHHFVNPNMAQGVSTPIWDFLFATRPAVDRVPVPRRMAMRWLVGSNGDVKAAYAHDYELVGAATRGAPAGCGADELPSTAPARGIPARDR